MRRGCISLGEVKCDMCQRLIPAYDRYLSVEEENDNEVNKGKLKNYCVDCARQKGFATVKEEKGEKTLTFLT